MTSHPENARSNGQQQARAGGWLRSLIGLFLGAAIMGCGLGLVEGVLHSGVTTMAVAWLALLPLTAGWLIACIDARCPPLVAAAACLLSVPLAVAAWASASEAPDFRFTAGNVLVSALPPIPGAVIGATVGWAIRRRRRSLIAAGWLVLAIAFGAFFILPWGLHRRDAKEFLRLHQSEVIADATNEPFHLPGRQLRWRSELWGHWYRGVRLKAEWEVTTRAAGPGRCELDIGVAWRRNNAGYVVREVRFTYSPYRPAAVQTDRAAAALIQELGATWSPDLVFQDDQQAWLSQTLAAQPIPGGPPECVVTVRRDGRLSALITRY